MVLDTKTQALRLSAEKCRQSLDSLGDLLQATESLAQNNGGVSLEELATIQRKVLLDSFTVKKFHREYKEWEHFKKDQFVNTEIKWYNKKYAEMSRVYGDFEALQALFEELRNSMKIPSFYLSIQTLQNFENGALLGRVSKDDNGEFPQKVVLSHLFSLDSESPLPTPSFPVFNRLVNLEYRLRMLLQIEHEVLHRAKANLATKNRQWASRDAKLNLFITRDIVLVSEEIKKIRASEHEDLKYYEEDDDGINKEYGESIDEDIDEKVEKGEEANEDNVDDLAIEERNEMTNRVEEEVVMRTNGAVQVETEDTLEESNGEQVGDQAVEGSPIGESRPTPGENADEDILSPIEPIELTGITEHTEPNGHTDSSHEDQEDLDY